MVAFFVFLAGDFFACDFLAVVDFFAFALGADLDADASGATTLVASTLAGVAGTCVGDFVGDGADDGAGDCARTNDGVTNNAPVAITSAMSTRLYLRMFGTRTLDMFIS